MKSVILLVILTIGTALAGTHVNISFSQQQHAPNGVDLVETQKDQVQLQPTDSLGHHQRDSNFRGEQNDRFARIQVDDIKNNANDKNSQVAASSNVSHEPDSNYQSRSERVQNSGRSGNFNHQARDQPRGYYNSYNGESDQNYDQLRKTSAQDKQNMEFERYIQHYHSGPTVETVYESAKPRSQQSSVTASVNDGPQRVVAGHQRMSTMQKFERQVALPSTADSFQQEADATKQAQIVGNHQPVVAAETAASSSSSSATSVPSVMPNSPSGNSYKVNLNQSPSSVGKDGLNFDLSTSYSKPNYNDPTFQYDNDGHSDGNFHNQFPPSVEEPQGSYGDYFQPAYSNNGNHYYGNLYNSPQPEAGYLPAEHTNPRSHVTKTIQIAQPAIKAKKYEIRHPAIQKEFYDIEERVIIKPAGTVVVELERPVAKILKGETTLPLGHPHPAVAGAYQNNGPSPAFSNIIYSRSGGVSHPNHATNQYSPNYNTQSVPEHHTAKSGFTFASAATKGPSFEQGAKEVHLESSLNKQHNRDSKFAAAVTSAEEAKPQNKEVVVVTDGKGNQRQVSSDQFAYSKDETDNSPSRPMYNHRNSFAYKSNNGQDNFAQQRSGFQDSSFNSGQSHNAPRRSGYHANLSNRDGYGFEAEYINNAGSANQQQDSKPARLQEASSKSTEHQQQPLFKHEHNIVVSPSQHNIYLTGKHDMPQTKFVAGAAHVREIKPFLQTHRGPFVLYASSKQSPDLPYTQRSEYQPQARVSSQIVNYRDPAAVRKAKVTDRHVEYSAPYAQMRFHPDGEENASSASFSIDRNGRRKSERLIIEDKPTTEVVVVKANENIMEKEAPQAHIEIEIPHHSTQDANNAIVVSSTIRPTMMNNGKHEMANSKLEISVTNNGEPMHQQNTNDNYEDISKDLQPDMPYNDDDTNEKDTEQISNLKTKPDCNLPSAASENYEAQSEYNSYEPQKFMRIVEGSTNAATSESDSKPAEAAVTNIQPHNVDVNAKSTTGHIIKPSSRVIAATPAPKESLPSESFNKRRIVVNHPFQTVREVVEHEPYTNYHEVQVNEPASPAHYHSANYFQSHGALRQPEHGHSASTAFYN